jgi:hypothetical protein
MSPSATVSHTGEIPPQGTPRHHPFIQGNGQEDLEMNFENEC